MTAPLQKLQKLAIDISPIADKEGMDALQTALTNIVGVQSFDIIESANGMQALVVINTHDTSVHAITAALNTVDYVTQPYPIDAPQHPDN